MHLSIVLCCGMQLHCLPTNYCQFHKQESLIVPSIVHIIVMTLTYLSLLLVRRIVTNYADFADVHCCIKFHVCTFLLYTCMFHCSLMCHIHKCIVNYDNNVEILLSISILVPSVVNVSIPFTELHKHAYLYCSCFGTKVHCLPTNYGNFVVRFLTLYCCTFP